MFKKKITFKIILFLVASDCLETVTEFCFKKSALTKSNFSVHSFQDAALFIYGVAHSPFLWLAFLSVLLTFIIWASILAKIDLSVAVPLASLSYLLVPLTSVIFLHEQISMLRWEGIIFILIGVIFVSISSKEKTVNIK